MARVAGVDIPENKRIEVALTYIHGVGPAMSKKILVLCNIGLDVRVKNLTDTDVANIRSAITAAGISVEGELRRTVSQNIKRLKDIKSYRGSRHTKGLPVRGQRTRSNARTRKGKRKTVGGMKKKLSKK
ncbi:MAG: SSU ribosomal protein S13p (S18e) [candidate division WWE3 bacterium GW2011_GWA1_46_21]|uniref:Small ribosomal subunit protein uS13 n=4 Tax=Katanobacteria TaxID=422282 RepID=A0A0G1PHE5_UNCKA|nr:MAG: SSU ribosomal protein S13p (S18e) [candidate division WWE3 bacterium GW2011_GWA1_46_21]KKU49153.1 MAG: SSU ribosomal protein S13p (S18e) [candidate division WWE3 bacterium GW2011_GWA2_46_9]KKU50864.1 MAG: SSU ribosomal protein S13p (S18e) [candidate division WWE3 bacterium GW2011_GWC1_47_10]KKU58140.1 MAG: SSU ribosomal protein S13p (S18e) [candidate division WWE3 bacterium GW2011_GWB1_47_11]